MNDLALEINKLIKESIEYKELKIAEDNMLNNKETFILLTKYQTLQDEYNDAIRFEKYGSNAENIKKELATVKYEVDTNELVKTYNEKYKIVTKMLSDITSTILEGLR